jgi:RNA polymerase sigma-70 factor, ECF subfamily
MRHLRRQSDGQVDRGLAVIVPFPVPKSDTGLVAALRAGHPDAVRVLCERHSREMLRVATRILGPAQSVDATVVEAIHRSLVGLDSLKDPRCLRAWLISRVISVAREQLRMQRRWRWALWRNRQRTHEQGSSHSDLMSATYRVLNCLDDDQRVVFCLAFIHSMGIADVATSLGISLARTRALLDKACLNFADGCANEPSYSFSCRFSA